MGTTLPDTLTCPSVGFKMPEITFSRVDFPAPLFPMTPSTSPFSRLKLTSRRAQNSLYRTFPFSICTRYSLMLLTWS